LLQSMIIRRGAWGKRFGTRGLEGPSVKSCLSNLTGSHLSEESKSEDSPGGTLFYKAVTGFHFRLSLPILRHPRVKSTGGELERRKRSRVDRGNGSQSNAVVGTAVI